MNETDERFETAELDETETLVIEEPECLEPPESWAVEDFDDLWH